MRRKQEKRLSGAYLPCPASQLETDDSLVIWNDENRSIGFEVYDAVTQGKQRIIITPPHKSTWLEGCSSLPD